MEHAQMTPTSQEPKGTVITDFEVHRKAFHDSMEKLQRQLATATAEINTLRVNLKTQTVEARVKTMARLHDVMSELDAARKEQHDLIEAHLKALHVDVEAINAELKHATASGKMAAEAKVKEIRREVENTRKASIASLEAELAEWKARVDEVVYAVDEKRTGTRAGVQAKMADLRAKHEAA
jgi:uncharacterized protein YicC (UPF0701 family)